MIQNSMNVVIPIFDNIISNLKIFNVEISLVTFESDQFLFIFICCQMLSTHPCNFFQIYQI